MAVYLRHTADDKCFGSGACGAPDGGAAFAVSLSSHRAGIDNLDIAPGEGVGNRVASPFQFFLDRCAFVLADFAAQCVNSDLQHGFSSVTTAFYHKF